MLLAGTSPASSDSAPVVTPTLPPVTVDVILAEAPPVSAPPAGAATPGAAPAPATPASTTPASATPATTPPATDAGEIIVTGQDQRAPGDPLGNVNIESFKVVQSVDKAIIGPVAVAYKEDLPSPIRKGVHNFINNLDEPVVFLNFLLQLKIGKAFETAGRFAINSTIGVGGLMDVAKKRPFNLPRRVNGFAYTLGYYGVKPGAYLFLPLIGSTTVRDLLGRTLDLAVVPAAFGKPFTSPAFAPVQGTLSSIDDRAEFDDDLQKLRDQNANPYAAVREYYLTRRQAEIDVLRGLRTSVDDPTPPARKHHRVAPPPVK